MATEIDARVGEFLAQRGPDDVPLASRPELLQLAAEIDSHYWLQVRTVLVRAARESPDRLDFSPDDRLLLDLGLVDWRVLPGGDSNRPALLRELYAEAPPNRFTLSEWIAQRFRQFVLCGGMTRDEGETLSATRIIRDMRTRLYMKLSPLFRNLPGFGRDHVELFLSGRIDETLYAMDRKRERHPDPRLAEQRVQLESIRTRLVTRARERARTDEDLALFDALRELDRQAVLKRAPRPPAVRPPRVLSPSEREEFVRSELRFLRSVLWLGVTGSGLARTHSVLLSGQPRVTKPDLDPVLGQIRTCDPTLPEASAFLIAPYVGGGFYEWDRDTVFIPLLPTRSAEEAAASATARYRLLLDRFQEGGKLLREYELAVGGDDPASAFVRDYRNWIHGVGKGFKGALDPARFNFFKTMIGPQPSNLYASRDWTALTPQERNDLLKACRDRVSRGEGTFDDHTTLAAAHAQQQHIAPALTELQAALKINPVDGRALLAMGHLSARLGAQETARKRLKECVSLAAGTLWAVYATDELNRL